MIRLALVLALLPSMAHAQRLDLSLTSDDSGWVRAWTGRVRRAHPDGASGDRPEERSYQLFVDGREVEGGVRLVAMQFTDVSFRAERGRWHTIELRENAVVVHTHRFWFAPEHDVGSIVPGGAARCFAIADVPSDPGITVEPNSWADPGIARDGDRVCVSLPVWSQWSWGHAKQAYDFGLVRWEVRGWPLQFVIHPLAAIACALAAYVIARRWLTRHAVPKLAIERPPDVVGLRDAAKSAWERITPRRGVSSFGPPFVESALAIDLVPDGAILSGDAIVRDGHYGPPIFAEAGSFVRAGLLILGEGPAIAILSASYASRLEAGAWAPSIPDAAAIDRARSTTATALRRPPPSVFARVATVTWLALTITMGIGAPFVAYGMGFLAAGRYEGAISIAAIVSIATAVFGARMVPR